MHLYLHIPFCRRACHYCDFHFSTQLQDKSVVVAAIVTEIEQRKDYLKNKELTSIYFGGGTPSLLNINELHDIFLKINEHFTIAPNAEITLEANPDDISSDRLKIWRKFGINRLSIGIQSFNDLYLKYMNRIHSGEMAEKSVKLAQAEGIENISIDLIYAVNPLHTKPSKRITKNELQLTEIDFHTSWKNDIEKALSLGVPHISSYCLTIEEKTVFGSWVKNNQIPTVDDDFASQQFDLLVNSLENSGFEQYEISNFARNNHYAIHNTSYWKGEEYLGVGPSAHSFNGVSRQFNVSNNTKYVRAVNEKVPYFEIEMLTPENKANELIMTGLRTQWGVSIAAIEQQIGTLPQWFYDRVTTKKNQGLLRHENNFLLLTRQGKFLADGIASELFF